mmetsp:Transcript_11413/g.17558  ORF Transcript_11413/g.17558 Transcript_11413/m.17558 type:complete len:179 (-) Transcript_11413:47-583(-)|eukprot:CAMPEP_0178919134 /NCGR_PEP_ID=MMETSP0786-20121207/14257_1 /TAXON_ID=186022 /ORGANISM="Thalassionema frauenfeldii, Strain CCMP 1798" /LENGTH=178 /DNA_ID=CAMNT_0020593009 /DNA_START=342 /DNA_END=878 /DNA_ORIENTATION=+
MGNQLTKDFSSRSEDEFVVARGLPDDMLFVIIDFAPFPTLCRVKPVCKCWIQSIDRHFVLRLGKKKFAANAELIEAVGKYCYDKRKHSEELATTYGWPIGKWDVSEVTDFSRILKAKSSFNEYIREWNVSNGTYFYSMFYYASSFNQDIGCWEVSKATSFWHMFYEAKCFNQDLSIGH